METTIWKAVRQARRQLGGQILRDCMLCGSCAGAGASVIFLFGSLFFPVYGAERIAAGLLLTGSLAGFLTGLYRRPGMKSAAAQADRTGLQEHLVTALERRDKEDMFSVLQREETVRMLTGYPLRERLKRPVSGRNIGILAGCLVLAVVLSLIPTQAKLTAQKQHELALAKKEQLEQIEEALEQMEQSAGELTDPEGLPAMSAEAGEEWKKMLAEGQQEIRQAASEKELAEIARRLDKKKEQLQQAGMQAAAGQAGQFADGQEPENTGEGAWQPAEQSASQPAGQAGETAGGRVSGTGAESGQSGDGSSPAVSGGSGSGTAITQTAGSSAAGSGSASSGAAIAQAGSGGTGQGSAGSGGNNGGGQNGSAGNGTGSGGNGAGSGSGNAGNGGSGGNGQGAGNGGGWNQGSSIGIEREHESTLGAETVILPGQVTDSENLTGTLGTDGTSYLAPDQVMGEGYAGTRTEYEQILGAYTEKAYSQIEQNEIPSSMQDVVKNYFSGLSK